MRTWRIEAGVMGLVLGAFLGASTVLATAPPAGELYKRGLELYGAGRYSEATDSFEQSIRRKEYTADSQAYIERIRKETVERIRNKALTGVSKTSWQTKYYYMNEMDGRVRVGISMQEVFERDSANFRPGAIDALSQLAGIFARAENGNFEVDLISEINSEAPADPMLSVQQQSAVYSYLSLASRNSLTKF